MATVHGSGADTTARFTIRGPRWRIISTMSYQGTCTFIVFCSGPSATVSGPAGASSFDLPDGRLQPQTFAAGAGRFNLKVTPESNSTRWTVWIQDWY
ncbi:MAG: hypothetical protein NVS2B16_28450 [Chloroflexota bacterium]